MRAILKSRLFLVSISLLIILLLFITYGYHYISDGKNERSGIYTLDELSSVDLIVNYEKITSISENDVNILENYGNRKNTLLADGFEFYNIEYNSDEFIISGRIVAPHDYLSKQYPILIHNRGGHDSYGKESFGFQAALSSYGFIVVASDYRTDEFGGNAKDEYGGKDIEDVYRLIDLAELFTFSNGKIYMHGTSRGGMMTYIALRGGDSRINAASVSCAPVDLKISFEKADRKLRSVLFQKLGGQPRFVPDAYEQRSAIYWHEELYTPILISQGANDDRVDSESVLQFYDKMNADGKVVELKYYENLGHEITQESVEYSMQWLLKY